MRVSIIAAIYNNVDALIHIVKALKEQDYSDFVLIVAEDGNDQKISEYQKSVSGIDILHTTQKDIGLPKARSQNNAIIESTGDYLIFIDGDCIPHHNFISSHAALSEKGRVPSGIRVNFGPPISKAIRNDSLKSSTLENRYLLFSPILWSDGATHIGQGIRISPQGWLYKKHISQRKKSNTNILRCNFSCFKKYFIKIDGFDEGYGEACIPDDTDVQWRFEAANFKIKSYKLIANVFHLHHIPHSKLDKSISDSMINKIHLRKNNGVHLAEIGISSH